MKKILITGPTGAIGTALLRQCIDEEIEVYAIVHPGSNRMDHILRADTIHIISAGLDCIDNLTEMIEERGFDAFFHLAWCGTFGEARDSEEMQQINVQYALNAVMLAKELECKSFVFAGSQAEFGRVEGRLSGELVCRPENAYGRTKLAAGEQTRALCKQLGIRHIYTRILSVYGPNDGENTMISYTIRLLQRGESPKFTPAEQLWDYMYSEDAARALLLLAKTGKTDKIYCIGSGQARPLREYIETIGTIVNPDVKLEIGAIPYRQDQVMFLCADISALVEDTGFQSSMLFDEGIKQILLEQKS